MTLIKYVGVAPVSPEIEAMFQTILDRLSASASGFVLARRLRGMHRRAAALLVERSELEAFQHPTGKAYRLAVKGQP